MEHVRNEKYLFCWLGTKNILLVSNYSAAVPPSKHKIISRHNNINLMLQEVIIKNTFFWGHERRCVFCRKR